jgi:hypothetical protein
MFNARRPAGASALVLWIALSGCGSAPSSFEPQAPRDEGTGSDAATPGTGDDGGVSASDGANPDDGGVGPTADGSAPAPLDSGPPADAANDAATDDGGGDDAGSPCSGGTALSASDAPGVMASTEYAAVKWIVSSKTDLVGLWTTMVVPAKPSATSGTLYVWPGVQPYSNSASFYPIGDGILQPVLSVGPTCGPGAPSDYASWWISGQYVNPNGPAGFNGCLGGDGMDAAPGDNLDIAITLSGTVWTQVVANRKSGKKVSFALDLKGQGQNWATLAIEQPTALKPVSDVIYTSTRLTFAASDPTSCQPSQHGPNDYFATPYVSKDGKTCCVSRVILREQGVAATTMNGP